MPDGASRTAAPHLRGERRAGHSQAVGDQAGRDQAVHGQALGDAAVRGPAVRDCRGRHRAHAERAGRAVPGAWPGSLALLWICLTAALGLALFLVPLRGIALGRMSGLGLISVLPVASLAGLALLVLAFAALLARGRPDRVVLGLMLVGIIICLDGVTAIAEPLPRFATSYQVAGFVNYISQTGHVAPGAAAYFSWPGFFALIAFVAGAAGAHSLLPLLAWWPALIDALYLVPFMLITRSLGLGWRARWFAAVLFSVGNWVGQDYFSPQSFNYLLYLAFVAILLTWFSGRPAAKVVSGAQRAILLLLLIGIFATSTVSHQLTPFLMLATCAGLVIVRRCTLRGLPVLLGVILIGWISFGTVAYWSGHLSTIFGHIGQVGGNISSSVGNRIIGTPVHQLALYSRILLPAVMAGMAIVGLLRRWRARSDSRALLVLLCAPVTAAGLQNYGGEISLRVYLFALPAAAMLAACLFFPPGRAAGQAADRVVDEAADQAADQAAEPLAPAAAARHARRIIAGPTRRIIAGPTKRIVAWHARRIVARPARGIVARTVAAGLVGVSLAGLFLVARYGNDAFEQVPAGELTAMNYIYAHDHGGTSVLWLSEPANVNATPEMPWQYRDITRVRFVAMRAARNPGDVAGVVTALRKLGRGSYLITTATEAAYLRQTGSYPADWATRFRAAMAAAPGVRVVLANRTAAVYSARQPADLAPKPSVSVGGGSSGWTSWTPAGLAALVLVLLVLLTRTFVAECGPDWRRLLRPLTLVSLPLLTLLLFVVAERFVVLS
jgi:hypothetical protein